MAAGLLIAASTGLFAQAPLNLSVLARFDREPSVAILEAMQEEVSVLFRDTGAEIRWQRLGSENHLGVTKNVVTVHFQGTCRLEWFRLSGSSILAAVTRVDGWVQPFIQVDCASTLAHVRTGFYEESHYRNAGRIFGRALGRVLAHELYHYLTQTAEHRHSALFSPSLRPNRLVAEVVAFEPCEVQLLREALLALAAPYGVTVGL